MGSGKDIGKDKPAFGWELEPFVAFGSISGNVPLGEILNKKECENMRWPCGLGSSYLVVDARCWAQTPCARQTPTPEP